MAILETIYLVANNWLILDIIFSVKQQYLKPFNYMQILKGNT